MKSLIKCILFLALSCISLAASVPAQSSDPVLTTAWHENRFQVDVAGILSRSSIVLSQPNLLAAQAMPLGNGRLGVAVWSDNGLTAQLNRADTLPDRLSPGEIVVPGLVTLTQAKDYLGRLDLYDGEFRERGGGMTATAYVQPDSDTLIIDVSGAAPGEPQSALLRLWAPRTPQATVRGQVGLLSQSWIDDQHPGASDRKFGSLSAITGDARGVSVAVTDPLTIRLSFMPYEDGHFRIIVAAPHYDGSLNSQAVVQRALSARSEVANKAWWHNYWSHAGVIRITSKDGSGEYLENLRNIYLFAAAAEKGDEYPGSQAGVADMLSSARDTHHWDSSAFWHWNLRMQVAANIGAGVPELNEPFFNLYRENLPAIENWTKTYMRRPGACIAETMRFNGQGIEYESTWPGFNVPGKIGRDCDLSFTPYFNARTLTTGAEVSLWVWEQYLATNDRKFLFDNYPIIAASARFLLSSQKLGPDKLLHTSPSNAHETQWDVVDPTTDIAAALALYPVAIEAAKLVNKDADLAEELKAALPKIPEFPRTQLTRPFTLLPPSADADGVDMIAESYLPDAPNHNGENIGLEPVWPYSVIGDTSPLFALAKRTYEHRLSSRGGYWSFDPIQAARLAMGNEVRAALLRSTENSARCVNGFTGCESRGTGAGTDDAADLNSRELEFYIEQSGVAADALQEALVQDYDGLIRIAPAIPTGWDFDGSVWIQGKTKVDVQVRDGVPTTVVIESGIAQQLKIRNPWPDQQIDIVEGKTGTKVVDGAAGSVLLFNALAGTKYLIERLGIPTTNQRFESISGSSTVSAKRLGPVQLGLFGVGQ
jgi:alpha-L-fucosidase 2